MEREGGEKREWRVGTKIRKVEMEQGERGK